MSTLITRHMKFIELERGELENLLYTFINYKVGGSCTNCLA